MKITQLNHVAVHVADVEQSTRFYRDLLGLPTMPRPGFSFPGAWFRVGQGDDFQEVHLIGRPVGDAPPPRERHVAFMVDDIDAWAEALREKGVEHTGPKLRPDGAKQVFLRDPDGHVIELCTPPAK